MNRRWTPETIARAMIDFRLENGRPLRSNDVSGRAAPPGVPSGDAIRRHYGSFRNACEAVYGQGLEPGGRWATKDADTERVIVALYAGSTLTDLAAERGVTGQALGRRVVRYLRSRGLPVMRRKPGRPGTRERVA